MLNSIFHAVSFAAQDIAMMMCCSLGLGLVIALLFALTETEGGTFARVLAVMPLLVSVVIMIVNGNIGASVAVLGAFGLVRFRSAPGSARDIAFLFFSMAVGLAAGMGFLSLAALITVVTGASIVLIEKTGFGRITPRSRRLRITIPEDLSYNGLFDDLFARYTEQVQLERVKTSNMGTMYELSYRLVLRSAEQEKEFLDALRCRNGNLTISLGLVQPEKNTL